MARPPSARNGHSSSTSEKRELPLPASSREGAARSLHTAARNAIRRVVYLALVLSCVAYCFGIVPLLIHRMPWLGRPKRTNVIFMISDGYGPASATLGRSYLQYAAGREHHEASSNELLTPLDRLLVGTHRSRSANSLVTDSAAGATAFACGLKTNNYAIGVDAENRPCGTVLEGAKERGLLTGVVVTTRITDATPASYFAHVTSRGQESEIANEVLGLNENGTSYRNSPLDLAIGGGGCYFLPKSHPQSCRKDELDLVALARKQGWKTDVYFDKDSTSRDGAESILPEKSDLPFMGLLTPFNTPFVIDRAKSMAALPAMAQFALNSLQNSKQNKKGFFIMIEGSQIDLCAHANDPACHVREIAEYQQTISSVIKWANEAHRKYGDDTLILSTSDHETGGLDLAMQQGEEPLYAYYPARLYGVRHSSQFLAEKLVDFAKDSKPAPSIEQLQDFIRTDILGAEGADFTHANGGKPSRKEVAKVLACLNEHDNTLDLPGRDVPGGIVQVCQQEIAKRVSSRANLGWSTHGHTGVDINVYAFGRGSQVFRGNHDNNELGLLIAEHLKVDLAAVTRRLLRQREHEYL